MGNKKFIGLDWTGVESGQTVVYSGETWVAKTLAGGEIGPARDGDYNDGLMTWTDTEKVGFALDDVNEILALLAPPKPDDLSTIGTLTASISTYTCLSAGTSTTHQCYDVASYPNPQFYATSFFNGDDGILSCDIYSGGSFYEDGSITILDGVNNNGTNESLTIYENLDFHLGVAGKEGFWRYLNARVQTDTNFTVSDDFYKYVMKHSSTGNATSIEFYIDDPATVSLSNFTINSVESNPKYTSGVPSFNVGTTINFYYTVSNAVGKHYLNNISRITGDRINAFYESPVSTPNEGDTLNLTGTTTLTSGYDETLSYTVYGYNSKNVSSSLVGNTNYRIDTVSNETNRKTSGTGIYPSSYGDTYVSSSAITITNTNYSEELQMLNGRYRRPTTSDYSTKYPVGPDYSTDMGTGQRYITMMFGGYSNQDTFIVTLNGILGSWSQDANKVTAGITLQVKLVGGYDTGWLDLNEPTVTTPLANGDGCNNTSYAGVATNIKQATLGGTRTFTNIYVRVGLPDGSNKSFTGISVSI